MLTQKLKSDIISAAILAPSADNSQPWIFDWQDSTLLLRIDATRSGSISDTNYLLSDIASGSCLENIHIFLASLGIEHNIEILPNLDDPLLIAKVQLTGRSILPAEATLASMIPLRQSNRRFPFTPHAKRLTQKLLESASTPLTEAIDCSNGMQKKVACRALFKAESLRFQIKHVHEELFKTVRFNDKEGAQEGMDLRSLNIEPFARPIFKLASNWPTMAWLNKLGMSYVFGYRSTVLPTKLSPTLLLISPKENSRQGAISLGRTLERCWLSATAMGLSVQVYAAPGVFTCNHATIPNEHATTLQQITESMLTLNPAGTGGLFLRIGIDKHSSNNARTRRRNLTDFINE